MAKVTGPLHSSEARGKVGSEQYNTWRGLHIVKTNSGPTTTHSDAQIALRAITSFFTHRWADLTDAQRSSWNSFSAFHPDSDWTGQPKRLSGFNWYIRINVRLQLATNNLLEYPPPGWLGPRDDPPEDFEFIHWWIDDCSGDAGGQVDVSWSYDFVAVEKWLVEAYLVGPLSVGRNPTIKQADRKSVVVIGDYHFSWEAPLAGRYTYFIRQMNFHGITNGWLRVFADVT